MKKIGEITKKEWIKTCVYLVLYILFLKFSEMFVFTGTMSAGLALWLPNFVYILIAAVLYRRAPK